VPRADGGAPLSLDAERLAQADDDLLNLVVMNPQSAEILR